MRKNTASILDKLAEIIKERSNNPAAIKSWTRALLKENKSLVIRKLGEETIETMIAAFEEKPENVVNESVDIIYHLMVLWEKLGISPERIWNEIEKRMHKND